VIKVPLDNRENLIKAVIDQSHRDDLNLKMSDFLTLTEQEIESNPIQALKLSSGEISTDLTASTASRFLSLPSGFSSSRKFSITIQDNEYVIRYVTPNKMHVRPDTGVPLNFTIRANQIEFDILPDDTYTLTVTYFQEFTPLVNPTDTNIVLTKYPSIYLYGMLRQAFVYSQDSEQESKYSALFFSAIDSANKREKDLMYGPSLQMSASWCP